MALLKPDLNPAGVPVTYHRISAQTLMFAAQTREGSEQLKIPAIPAVVVDVVVDSYRSQMARMDGERPLMRREFRLIGVSKEAGVVDVYHALAELPEFEGAEVV